MLDEEQLRMAFDSWSSGNSLLAGRMIFESIPNHLRPKWAAGILRLILARSGIQSPLFDKVIRTAENPAVWVNGHRVFSAVRDEVLKYDLPRQHGLLYYTLCLAELVAKVTYNATNPPDEFDEDSGWYIVPTVRGFVDRVWSDEDFSKAAWAAVCFRGEV